MNKQPSIRRSVVVERIEKRGSRLAGSKEKAVPNVGVVEVCLMEEILHYAQ